MSMYSLPATTPQTTTPEGILTDTLDHFGIGTTGWLIDPQGGNVRRADFIAELIARLTDDYSDQLQDIYELVEGNKTELARKIREVLGAL